MEVDEININADDIYVKQTNRNRATILGPNKIQHLIIPVHASSTKTPNKDVQIDNKMPWQRTQLRTIEAAYKNSTFYQYYDYLFIDLFKKKYTFLLDLQMDSLTICLQSLQLTKTICQSRSFEDKTPIDFNAKGLSENLQFKPYLQNFGNEFVPNLSIIDLLFCMGPETPLFLRKQTKSEQ
jgi:hypothetical protein